MRKFYVIFILAIVFISYLSLWRGLSFDFWRDDWGQLWSAVYKPQLILHEWAAIRLHPGGAWEQFLGSKVFGLNPFGWQIFGLLLKVLDSMAVALMVYAVSKSKRVMILSGVFFASLLSGLESFVWLSAHTSALFILFFSLGMYLWFGSEDEEKFSLRFFLSLLVLFGSVLISPGRGISVLFLIPLWGFLTIIRLQKREVIIRVVARMVFTLVPLLFLLARFNTNTVSYESLRQKWQLLFVNPGLIKIFLASVGNLLVGWIKPVSEVGSLTNISMSSYRVGAVFFFVSFLVWLFFLLKKTKMVQILIFFLAWMPIFYLPNWLFDQTLALGTSHRYLTISSVGLAAVAALIISSLKRKYAVLIAILFIILNVRSSNIVLASQAKYRSSDVVESIWKKINADVPKGEKDSIFMYGGGDYLRGVALDWSGSVPFGIMRGVADEDDFPIATGDKDLIVKLICEGNVERPSLGKWSVQKERIPLSHLHVWTLNDGVLNNISSEKRNEIRLILTCRNY